MRRSPFFGWPADGTSCLGEQGDECELTSNEEGAYDGGPVHQAVSERQPDPPVAVVTPPRSTAVPSPAAGTTPSQRGRHIQVIGDKGCMGRIHRRVAPGISDLAW